MPFRHDAADSLRHIVENAERVARHLAGLDRAEFERSESARDAVKRCTERVCEAAHRLGERAEELMPSQPWGDIRGLGNPLRHAHDRIEVDIVWTTAKVRLPELADEAERVLAHLTAPEQLK